MPDVRGGGTVKVGSVTLTAAQVQGLVSAPVTVVAAGGAGTVIVILAATAYIDYNSVAYTGGADLVLQYGTGTGDIVLFDGVLALTADKVMVASPSGTDTSAAIANAPVVVTSDDVPAAGNSPVTVSVVYTLIYL